MTSPLAAYQTHTQTPGFRQDAVQEQAVRHLQRVYTELLAGESTTSHWFGRKTPTLVRGVYLWGGVGRGKTFLMDLLFHNLPIANKLRLHFYRFMERIHHELTAHYQEKDPIVLVAKKIASEARIICLDEFMVEDIADAMILALLLKALFAEGVCLVTTSNVEPKELYREGLQRAQFLPAIELLTTQLEVVNVDAGVDYRQQPVPMANRFLTPLVQEREFMQSHFEALTVGQARLPLTIDIKGRPLQAIARTQNVLWIEFNELCKAPRCPIDYIELANQYRTVLISRVTQLSDNTDDYARRFVSLIDEFYDHQVAIILSANVPIAELYVGERLRVVFERTRSRLQEMLFYSSPARSAQHPLPPPP